MIRATKIIIPQIIKEMIKIEAKMKTEGTMAKNIPIISKKILISLIPKMRRSLNLNLVKYKESNSRFQNMA